jgi:hypothetical protein
MMVPGASISKRTVIGASVAGSLLQAILLGAHAWIRNVARGTLPRFGVDTLLGAVTGVASTAIAVASFLVAVLLVSIDAAPRRVATAIGVIGIATALWVARRQTTGPDETRGHSVVTID